MKKLSCFVVIAAAFLTAAAQLNYHGLAVAPDGQSAWVVTIDTVAVYHTGDFGGAWDYQEILTVRDFFDVTCVDANEAWTCGRIGTIYHTTNAGQTWERQSLGGPKFSTRIRFLDSERGWAASGEAIILKTTDGGGFWEMLFFPNPPFPSDTVDWQGVWFATPDTGWVVAGRWPEGDTFVGGQGYIARTNDNCVNWDLQWLDDSFDFYDVHFFSTTEGVVVGGNDRDLSGVVMRSDDGGANWAPMDIPAGTKFLRGVAFKGDHGWACGRNGTVIHSSDRGLSWEDQSVPVDTTFFDVEFADSLRGMVAGNSVVMATTDGGNTWQRVYGGIAEERPAPPVVSGPRLAVRPAGGSVRFAVGGVRGEWAVELYDAAGRERAAIGGLGEATATWDGRSAAGAPVPAGLYIARLESAEGATTARFVYLP